MKRTNPNRENSIWLRLCGKGLPGIVIAIFIGIFIQLKYQYHFFLEEQISLFAFDGQHVLSYLDKPCFFSKFIGDFITQFFYLRGMAAVIVSLLFLMLYYSVKSVCEDLNCGTQKACKLLDELEKVGALERKRQGLGKPNKLYLKKVF